MVTFSVLKGGQPLIVNEAIGAQEGSFETPFSVKYPDQVWLSDSALRLGDRKRFAEQQDLIRLTNNSRRNLTYVRVYTRDEYLAFDVPPRAELTLPTHWPPVRGAESKTLTVFTKFAGDENVSQASASFNAANDQRSPAHFQVSITDGGVEITNRDDKR